MESSVLRVFVIWVVIVPGTIAASGSGMGQDSFLGQAGQCFLFNFAFHMY